MTRNDEAADRLAVLSDQPVAEPVAYIDNKGNLSAHINGNLVELLKALPPAPFGTSLLPLYAAPQPVSLPAGMEALQYLLTCVETHADKFPAPSHMRAHVATVRAALAARPPIPEAQGVEATDTLKEAQRIIETFGRADSVRDMAMRLFEAWVKADPESGVSRNPVSYLANFVDMARTVLAAQPASDAAPAPDKCFRDGSPCYVGGDEPHFRCGTYACGRKPAPTTEAVEAQGDGWIEWKPGDFVPGGHVTVKTPTMLVSDQADRLCWTECSSITAYRITPQAEKGA